MRKTGQQGEDERLRAYMDQYQANEPFIQIYRLEENQHGKRPPETNESGHHNVRREY